MLNNTLNLYHNAKLLEAASTIQKLPVMTHARYDLPSYSTKITEEEIYERTKEGSI
jgi:hypothetical protein